MTAFGGIAFLQPAFLIALLALPILWWLLRAVPPAPRRERFPGVRILLGLDDRERTPDRTPWWLLLMRMLAVAALIAAFAEPLLNPKARIGGEGPLVVVMDGGWGSAPDWEARRAAALDVIEQARDAGRPVALEILADPSPAPDRFEPLDAESQARAISALEPYAWRPDPTRIAAAVEAAGSGLDVVWFHDGLDHSAAAIVAPRDPDALDAAATIEDEAIEDEASGAPETEDAVVAALATAIVEKGALRLVGPQNLARGLIAVDVQDGDMVATVARAETGDAESLRVVATGAASDGGERRLASAVAEFGPDEALATATLTLPIELRNALTRLDIDGAGHAGGAGLIDDRLRRRSAALVSGERGRSNQPLLSGQHYLRSALQPHAEYRETSLIEALGGAAPDDSAAFADAAEALDVSESWADVIVLSDIGRFDAAEERALVDWVEAGGLLVRFAGPQLAAAAAEATGPGAFRGDDWDDPLMPVRLRGGGRALGGALSWATPQRLSPFSDESPFAGIQAPREVSVARQVLAEPSPELSGRVWATLEDGTPLVTSRSVGEGRVVLFHVTASAAWSSLPLSGLFVEMMGRLVAVAPALAASASALAEEASVWKPETTMDAYGAVERADEGAAPVEGAALAVATATGAPLGVAPGVYVSDDDGATRRLAVSALGPDGALAPRPTAPAGATVETLSETSETPLKPFLLAFGLLLLLIDAFIALALAGRLRVARAAVVLAVGLTAVAAPDGARAQTADAPQEPSAVADADRIDPAERRAALESVLGYIVTGDPPVDRVSAAGLLGLSATLYERTAIEPGEPAAVDVENDELAVYAILYWPITRRQPDLSDNAVRKLNAFMRTGGLLVIDTRDAHQTFGAGDGPNARELRRLAGRLDMPPLSAAPRDHILTRSFYLLDELPGRWAGGQVWVEARAAGSAGDGAPANANDGVSPIIIGGADWAGAWAIDDNGLPLFAMGRGGERQREMAWRFGVNMAMYAFTGNYKSDQVHIPALLERLGN